MLLYFVFGFGNWELYDWWFIYLYLSTWY